MIGAEVQAVPHVHDVSLGTFAAPLGTFGRSILIARGRSQGVWQSGVGVTAGRSPT